MVKKHKVLHLIQSLEPGGCENFLLRVLPLVDDSEHLIVTLNQEGKLARKFVKSGIKVKRAGNLWSLTEIIKREKPNLVITYLARADMIGRFWLSWVLNCPVIPYLRTTYNYPRYWFVRFLERISHIWAKRYLANSEAVKNFYVERIGVARNKITVITNGLDLKSFGNSKIKNKRKEVVFVCVANFHPNKGHEYLIEAFRNLKGLGRLILVGGGKREEELKLMAADLGDKVLFLGVRDDVVDILKSADVFVLPTLFEGMSNAILEAMAMALPVITTDIPENRELIKNNQDGILVRAGDVAALTRAMRRLAVNYVLRKELGMAAKGVIVREYDIRVIAQKLNKFIEVNAS